MEEATFWMFIGTSYLAIELRLSSNQSSELLIDWLADWSIECLIDDWWLSVRLVCWFIDWFIHLLFNWWADWLIGWLIQFLSHWSLYWFVDYIVYCLADRKSCNAHHLFFQSAHLHPAVDEAAQNLIEALDDVKMHLEEIAGDTGVVTALVESITKAVARVCSVVQTELLKS